MKKQNIANEQSNQAPKTDREKTEPFMAPMTGDILDFPVTKTPFHLEDGWEMVCNNINSSCSHAEIEMLIQKRIINLIDLEIMKVLASFHYINHHNLHRALSTRLHPGYQKNSYLDNIRKLKKAGILLSFLPVKTESAEAKGISAVPTSPLRLYCLSQPAYSYMEAIVENPHPVLPSSARRKSELAAAGQFLIAFIEHYRDKITGYEYEKGTKIGSTPFLIDAVIRYQMLFPLHQETELVTLLLLSVRKTEKWEKAAITRLRMLNIWLSRHTSRCRLPFIVLTVEDISVAVTLYAKMQETEELANLPVYFCPDSLLMVYPPLQALYRCERGEDGKVNAVRIVIDGI